MDTELPETSNLSALAIAHSMLEKQYFVMTSACQKLMTRDETEYLHDLRVAIRRFRTTLGFYSNILQDTSMLTISQQLKGISASLSLYRDTDAWLEFVSNKSTMDVLGSNIEFTIYVDKLTSHRLSLIPNLRLFIKNNINNEFKNKIDYFLTCEIFNQDKIGNQDYNSFAKTKILTAYKKLVKLEKPTPTSSHNDIHEIRKKFRKNTLFGRIMSSSKNKAVSYSRKAMQGDFLITRNNSRFTFDVDT